MILFNTPLAFKKCLALALPVLALTACGGDDVEDRLDIADPVVRFVHASPMSPNLKLFRDDVARADVSDATYQSVSDYSYSDSGAATWKIQTSTASALIGTLAIDTKRGNRYTIVSFPTANGDSGLYEIRDPYNKSITSEKARVRFMNGASSTGNLDLYFAPIGGDISSSSIVPFIANTAYRMARPESGNDSLDIEYGNYELIVTRAGNKAALFKGTLSVGKDNDVLLIALPNQSQPESIKVILKLDGQGASRELPAN